MIPRLTVTAEATFGMTLKGYEDYIGSGNAISNRAARYALNDTAKGFALRRIRDAMSRDVAFPPGYLDQPDKLRVDSLATDAKLEVSIKARARATSLARFAAPAARGQPVRVTVKPGATQTLQRAFFVKLKSGASLTEDNFNIGLAVRLAPGQTLRNVRDERVVHLDHNLYLLYGPSVDQVFEGAAERESPAIIEEVSREYRRQFQRLSEDGIS